MKVCLSKERGGGDARIEVKEQGNQARETMVCTTEVVATKGWLYWKGARTPGQKAEKNRLKISCVVQRRRAKTPPQRVKRGKGG